MPVTVPVVSTVPPTIAALALGAKPNRIIKNPKVMRRINLFIFTFSPFYGPVTSVEVIVAL